MGKFNGYIGITEVDSISSHLADDTTKKPNVVYVVLDDIGFAHLGCYGSNIQTPNLNKIANRGLRYNNFHTTAICSATRASLLTGANHHTVGVSTVVDTLDGSFPNKNGYLDPSYATTAEVLKTYGYANFAVGKWHLAPFNEATDAGPFTNWPLSKGFDRFYGFMEGYTDQYTPDLVKDNEHIRPPKSPEEGYHLSEDLADQAIKLVNRQHVVYPEQPFFLYFAPGTAHSPHQAPKEYIDRYKGKYDEGWDVIREKWFENQKKLGIIPEDSVLNPRNEYVRAWNDLNDNEKKVFAKYMEVFAGFVEHADAQIGRVIDYIEEIGELDNTIIVVISDNGASAEGGRNGHINQEISINIEEENNNVELTLPHLDELGSSVYTNPHYPTGWANAGNTPFQWYKSWVHSGGVKDPFIISYPNGISSRGEIRGQFAHVTDIAPTVLDLIGVEKPSHIKGVPQKDYHGVSLKPTLDHAEAPNQKHIQYFEQTGNRGLWKDGWKVVTSHIGTDDYVNEEWELYHVEEDYTESHNLADQYPEKVKELVTLWYVEAGKYGVLPLGPGPYLVKNLQELSSSVVDKTFYITDQVFEYKGLRYPLDINIKTMFNRRNWKLTVDTVFHKGDEGVLYSAGNRFGGYTLYVKGNHLKFAYNYHQQKYFNVVSADEIPEGKVKLQVRFKLGDKAAVAKAELYINGKYQGETEVTNFIMMLETHANLKSSGSSPVTNDIIGPYEYPNILDNVEIIGASYTTSRDEIEEKFFAID